MKRNPLVAVDSNVLLDRASDDELVIDAIATIRRRLPACEIVVTPTVVEEIVLKAERDDRVLDRRLAGRVLASLVNPWRFRALNFIPVGRGIVAEIAQRLRQRGLIPATEMNDSLIVAEAGLIGATPLVSSDAHLKDLDYAQLKLLLDSADVETPLIASPYKIVHQFF